MTQLLVLAGFFFASCISYGQGSDSISINTKTADSSDVATIQDTQERDDDFSIGLAFMALIGIGFMLVCIGIGVALTLLGVLIIVGLISFGVISTSVLVGLQQKSFLKGFKTFLMLAATIGGVFIGGAGLWLLNKFTHWWSEKFALLSGSVLGFLSGLILGFLVIYVFRKLTVYFKKQFEIES